MGYYFTVLVKGLLVKINSAIKTRRRMKTHFHKLFLSRRLPACDRGTYTVYVWCLPVAVENPPPAQKEHVNRLDSPTQRVSYKWKSMSISAWQIIRG